jgi:hypothetical protein
LPLSSVPLWRLIHACLVDIDTRTTARSGLARENGTAIDEHSELMNRIVTSASQTI